MDNGRTCVLIVEQAPELARLWASHLERQGMVTAIARSQAEAITALTTRDFDIIVTDLMLDQGSALAIADFANYRQPDARVIFVTNTTFFSDGSIFNHCSNTAAYLPRGTDPDDLAAMIDYHGAAVSRDRAARQGRARG